MKAWVLNQGATSLDDLHLVERDVPRPGWGEVLIRMRACSLNFRDQAIVRGQYIGGPVAADTVLLSDGAGEIVGLGDGVHDLALGDRVAGIFFQHWFEGPPNPGVGPALGASGALGMLSEYVVLPAQGVIRIARTLSFEEAACLPCAGVTAWNALMCGPRPVQAGDNVLVLGTGGVSLMALQIAKAVGARVVATSSSAGKRERVAAMGADATVNYRDNPQWGAEAATHTGGGFEHVVEVGGAGTLAQSIAAVGFGGKSR
jgi:NADPH:quinone reductase-like Zn-dependent oxidoreductase